MAGAKARAEQEFASARTQQEAERAEQAIKDTAAALKEVLRLKVTPLGIQGVLRKLVHLNIMLSAFVIHILQLMQPPLQVHGPTISKQTSALPTTPAERLPCRHGNSW